MKKLLLLLLFSSFIAVKVHAQLVINEVLYDPSNTALEGDANGDGIYSQTQDEFIEFVNTGSAPLNVSGYQIWDDTLIGSLVYVIPSGTIIQPQAALVVFGGGKPIGFFGGATVLADTGASGLSLANSGEIIAVKNNLGNTVLTFNSDALSNNPDESYTRNPDYTGAFVQHASVNIRKFSPGTKVNGDNFVTLSTKQVTFKVDLNAYNGNVDSVFVVGNFNQQCNNCNPLLDVNKDGMYEVSIPVSRDTIEYVFKLKSGGTFVQEQFLTTNSCTRLSGSNIVRYIILRGDSILKTNCFESCVACVNDISLKGVTDFITPAGGSGGKSVYLVANDTIPNLSIYGIGIANNGGGTNGQEYRFPKIAVSKGSQIMVVRDSVALAAYMSSCWSNINIVLVDTAGVVNQNGNDAVELYRVGEVVETFGDINQNGTGQPWEYTGSWAFKNSVGNWIYGAINCTSNSTTIFNSTCIFPICSLVNVLSINITTPGNDSTIKTNGGKLTLTATVLPNNATIKEVNWSVNDVSVAIIDSSGLLTGISDGIVVIKATARDGSNVEATKTIYVSGQLTKVSSIEVNSVGNVSVITQKGGTIQMIETVLPVDALNKEVSWSTSDTSKATISSNGMLTARSNGLVVVRARAKDASGVEGTKSITISNQLIKVTSIVVNGEGNRSTITQNGGTLQMVANVFPTTADVKEVSWSVSDEDIATITSDGLLEAANNGTVIVTATAKDTTGIKGIRSITITGQSNGLIENQNTSIQFFPNPIQNILHIQSEKEVTSFNIYSIYGKLVKTGMFELNKTDLSLLETGLYVLDVKINETWGRYKIIKN